MNIVFKNYSVAEEMVVKMSASFEITLTIHYASLMYAIINGWASSKLSRPVWWNYKELKYYCTHFNRRGIIAQICHSGISSEIQLHSITAVFYIGFREDISQPEEDGLLL